ncbi:hypothetical protein Pmani_032221 [Petrolisthes manimaculis]|uniref:Uncharacterized protein n=1 Tax=Petrolisthes manimaculis TaxID=1843537 RepID=A0AAE1NT14_9EUCA|nr:hypothetical protein Pmani_032221 [Petrolisthes manimaculis]
MRPPTTGVNVRPTAIGIRLTSLITWYPNRVAACMDILKRDTLGQFPFRPPHALLTHTEPRQQQRRPDNPSPDQQTFAPNILTKINPHTDTRR